MFFKKPLLDGATAPTSVSLGEHISSTRRRGQEDTTESTKQRERHTHTQKTQTNDTTTRERTTRTNTDNTRNISNYIDATKGKAFGCPAPFSPQEEHKHRTPLP